MEARDLEPGQVLRRAEHGWRVLTVEEVDPGRLGAPYVRLKCRDHRDEVQAFTLPSDEPVELVEP